MKRIFYIFLTLCGCMATVKAQQTDSVAVDNVATDSVVTPIDRRQAKAELKQARLEMKQAKQDLHFAIEEERKTRRVLKWHNELRIGWGDQLFESLMWHNPTFIATNMPTTWTNTYKENYKHNQHLWLEYQYYTAYWFSLGAMVDLSQVNWDIVTRNGKGAVVGTPTRGYFYNAVVMPTIRFTYISHPYANLYSGLGIGIDINGGSELNAYHESTEVGLAVNLTLIGTSINYDRWFFCVDIGGLTALRNTNYIYMAFSRIFNVGIGVRF